MGLPLAVAFAKKRITIGFDLNPERISQLQSGVDLNFEVSATDLMSAKNLKVTNKISDIEHSNVYVITVPTPVDDQNMPNFDHLVSASEIVGSVLRENDIVIYESTVYPGATEEICVPVLENISRLKFNQNFFVGYSPERINPGDSKHKLDNTIKIVSGSTPETVSLIKSLYEEIVIAGVFVASSIKVAEAAKIIENTQRDLNIALINELSLIFYKLGIDTLEVLEAAGTKWNFLPFRPGLVGGHCIGVDPYYLTHKSEMLGYSPQIILAGRRINNSMAKFVAQECIKKIANKKIYSKAARVTVLGLTFKENCSDIRNSKVADLVREFLDFGCDVQIHDPVAEASEVKNEYDIDLMPWDKLFLADTIIVAVPHKQFFDISIDDLLKKLKPGGLFVDLRSHYSKKGIKEQGFHVWAL